MVTIAEFIYQTDFWNYFLESNNNIWDPETFVILNRAIFSEKLKKILHDS